MNTCNNQMNQDQSEAICHLTGPCIVIAPPGSGKTFTLTKRIEYLTTKAGVAPESILVITFTKAAAAEMKARYLSLTGETQTAVSFGTFHAVYFGILRGSFSYDGKALLTPAQKLRLLGDVCEPFKEKLPDEQQIEPEQILEELSRMKNQGKKLQEYETLAMDAELFREISTQYLNACKREKKLDFDDMVLFCKEALETHPEVLKRWQERFRYILVDEFQDINAIQYDVLRMLAAPENNLFMVGDDDQSIYGFRGSDPSLMLSLQKDYPDIREIHLKNNYRSAGEIIKAAGKLIKNNKLRYEKEVIACAGGRGTVKFEVFEEDEKQQKAILDFIKSLKKTSDIAIITRTNALLPKFAKLLSIGGIPFVSREKIKNPYEHPAVKDVEAYLKLAIGEAGRTDFFRIMNKPLRYLARIAVPADMENWADALKSYYSTKPYMMRILCAFEEQLGYIRRFSPFAAINYIRRGIGYEDAVTEELVQETEKEEYVRTLGMLQSMARDYDSHRMFLKALQDKRKAFERSMDISAEPSEGVTLITMHGAKGLEFENVILPDLNEKIVPHKRAYLPESVEEERRILYVAMTRAKQGLYMTAIQKGGNQKKEISRFIKELKV